MNWAQEMLVRSVVQNNPRLIPTPDTCDEMMGFPRGWTDPYGEASRGTDQFDIAVFHNGSPNADSSAWGLPAERAEFLAHPVSLTSSRFPNLLGHRSDERALPVHFCVLLSGFGLPALPIIKVV